MRTTIRHYSTIYKLVWGTNLEHYLQILKDHPFHAYHDATFFFLHGGDAETDYNLFFRVFRHSKQGIFCIEKGAYVVTTKDEKLTETWSVDEYYEYDDLKKVGKDLFHYYQAYCI